MFRKLVGAVAACVLVLGLGAAVARAQQAPGGETPAPVIKPVPALHKPMEKKPEATSAAKPEAMEKAAPAKVADLQYPPCSKSVKDRCIQLWQRDLAKTYPQCAKIKGADARAACIETAYKQDKK
ncbi:MAG TPA: hypothetical protein VMF53_02150 [Alphaproteobacteria bacterium]|nr:hypothetical protein [Alphaproteobacteria bacterium]